MIVAIAFRLVLDRKLAFLCAIRLGDRLFLSLYILLAGDSR